MTANLFDMSTALSSQLIPKSVIWSYLTETKKVSGEMPQSKEDGKFVIETWANGIRVVVKPIVNVLTIARNITTKGVSTIIGAVRLVSHIFSDNFKKGEGLNVSQIHNNTFLVESRQGSESHTLSIYSSYIQCSCYKYKCFRNRLQNEGGKLYQSLIDLVNPQGKKILSWTNSYGKVHFQIPCHHVLRLRSHLGIETMDEQVNSYTKILAKWNDRFVPKEKVQQVRKPTAEEQSEITTFLNKQAARKAGTQEPATLNPPRQWNDLEIKLPEPPAKADTSHVRQVSEAERAELAALLNPPKQWGNFNIDLGGYKPPTETEEDIPF